MNLYWGCILYMELHRKIILGYHACSVRWVPPNYQGSMALPHYNDIDVIDHPHKISDTIFCLPDSYAHFKVKYISSVWDSFETVILQVNHITLLTAYPHVAPLTVTPCTLPHVGVLANWYS